MGILIVKWIVYAIGFYFIWKLFFGGQEENENKQIEIEEKEAPPPKEKDITDKAELLRAERLKKK